MYIDNPMGGFIVSDAEAVSELRRRWETIRSEALPVAQSVRAHDGGSATMEQLIWRKSSRSNTLDGNCVEVAALSDRVLVRDFKNPDGPRLTVTASEWREFLRSQS
jgi:Domain of unknown function (DUF397).